MDNVPQVATYILIGLAAYFLLLPPVVAAAALKFKREPNVLRIDLHSEELPQVMRDPAFECRDLLEPCGFESLGGIALPDPLPNVRVIGEFFVNREEQAEAAVFVMFAMANEFWTMKKSYVEFVSEFRSGNLRQLSTADIGELGSFPDAADTLYFRLPDIADAEELWNCHRELVERHAAGLRKSLRVFEEFSDDPALRISATLQDDYERQVASGYLRLSRDGEHYRPTIKGAYLMVWKELWPIKNIRNALLRSRGTKVLDELDADAE